MEKARKKIIFVALMFNVDLECLLKHDTVKEGEQIPFTFI